MFIAHVLVAPSNQLKQTIQIEHNIVKNLNWPESNQLAIYKRGRGFELGATEKQIQVVVRAGRWIVCPTPCWPLSRAAFCFADNISTDIAVSNRASKTSTLNIKRLYRAGLPVR